MYMKVEQVRDSLPGKLYMYIRNIGAWLKQGWGEATNMQIGKCAKAIGCLQAVFSV